MIAVESRFRSYPLQLALTYDAPGHSGTSRTVEISPDVVSFLSDANLGTGMPIELQVDWPSTQSENEPLQLVLRGRISDGGGRVKRVQVLRHEFRTRFLAKTRRNGA
jgi:hypothetical protein